MKKQSFQVVALSAASPEAVFALLADGAGWSRWARPLVAASRWERLGDPAPGGVGAVRAPGRAPLLTREEIVEYDPPRRLAYTIVSGVPVRDHLGTVECTPLPGGGTRIDWRGSFVPALPGAGAPLRLAAAGVIGFLARRLARAAAHPAG